MAKMSLKKWAFTCLLLLLVTNTKCQKDDIKNKNSDSQQSIDEAERREGKPQESGNGKDTLKKFILIHTHTIYSKHVFVWLPAQLSSILFEFLTDSLWFLVQGIVSFS